MTHTDHLHIVDTDGPETYLVHARDAPHAINQINAHHDYEHTVSHKGTLDDAIDTVHDDGFAVLTE